MHVGLQICAELNNNHCFSPCQ